MEVAGKKIIRIHDGRLGKKTVPGNTRHARLVTVTPQHLLAEGEKARGRMAILLQNDRLAFLRKERIQPLLHVPAETKVFLGIDLVDLAVPRDAPLGLPSSLEAKSRLHSILPLGPVSDQPDPLRSVSLEDSHQLPHQTRSPVKDNGHWGFHRLEDRVAHGGQK